jgi:hypothetical protein
MVEEREFGVPFPHLPVWSRESSIKNYAISKTIKVAIKKQRARGREMSTTT